MKDMKMNGPISLGFLYGPGEFKLSHNAPDMENVRVCELTVQSISEHLVYVGWHGMDVSNGEGVLRLLTSVGEDFEIKTSSGGRILTIGDFGVKMPDPGTIILVTAKID